MTRTPEPAGPRQWTPGAGLERFKRETNLVPELTQADFDKAEALIAAANKRDAEESAKHQRAA
ncbi:hypothetical protein [Dactylosporangium sp. NPDC051541]|uniref:hypothetical protein n=1 Tax=Dactylosporangium sp. NPDC051541 TaxID=3363977 RepID=UPI003799DC62